MRRSGARRTSPPSPCVDSITASAARRSIRSASTSWSKRASGAGTAISARCNLHTLPASRPAAQIWGGERDDAQVADRPAYAGMLKRRELDRCGVTRLAGKAVGAPFAGATAATLALSEVLRLLHGGPVHELIDLDLKSP